MIWGYNRFSFVFSYFLVKLWYVNWFVYIYCGFLLCVFRGKFPWFFIVETFGLYFLWFSFTVWWVSFIFYFMLIDTFSCVYWLFLELGVVLFEIKINIIRPVTLTLRLLVNITVGHVVIEKGRVFGVFFIWNFIFLEGFVYFVQSFVFIQLRLSYLLSRI